MAQLIGEKDASVMDIGAGGQQLKKLLRTGIDYIPVDYKLIDGLDQTIIYDFDNGGFPDIKADCAFCAGILEYMEHPAEWIKEVCSHTKKEVLLSYHPARLFCDIRYREENGWVNHIVKKTLIRMFRENGFINERVEKSNGNEIIIKFVKKRKDDSKV